MDILQFLSSIVSSIAWPIVICFLIYLVRKDLGGLVQRLSKLKVPGGEALFDKSLTEAKQKALELQAESFTTQGAEIGQPNIDHSKTASLEKINPKKAILNSFDDMQSVLARKISVLPIERRHSPYDFIFREFYSKGIDKDLYDLFNRVQATYSIASQAEPSTISHSDAVEFQKLCDLISARFEAAFAAWRNR